VELFSLGVPVYRMRFRNIGSAPSIERFFRLIRACCALQEHGRETFQGLVECDETTYAQNAHQQAHRGQHKVEEKNQQ